MEKHGNSLQLGVGEVPDVFGFGATDEPLGFYIDSQDEKSLPKDLPRYRCTIYLDAPNVHEELTLQSEQQRWEDQGSQTFKWINEMRDKQITATARPCNSRAHLADSVIWSTIADIVAKVKSDQEHEEARLMGRGPLGLASVEQATVAEATVEEC